MFVFKQKICPFCPTKICPLKSLSSFIIIDFSNSAGNLLFFVASHYH